MWKFGNVVDWVWWFGGGYDYMMMFDVDSLMSVEVMIGMV